MTESQRGQFLMKFLSQVAGLEVQDQSMFCHKGNRTKFFRDGVLVNVLMFLVKLSLSSKVGEKHYAVRSSTFEKKGDIIAYKKLGLSRFVLKKTFFVWMFWYTDLSKKYCFKGRLKIIASAIRNLGKTRSNFPTTEAVIHFTCVLSKNYSEKYSKFTWKFQYKLFLVSFGELFITLFL